MGGQMDTQEGDLRGSLYDSKKITSAKIVRCSCWSRFSSLCATHPTFDITQGKPQLTETADSHNEPNNNLMPSGLSFLVQYRWGLLNP